MRVTVVFYGGLKQVIGTRQQVLEFDRQILTVHEMVDTLKARYPALMSRLSTVAYVVGSEIVEADYVLRDGDEAGLLPPVSGG